MDLRKFFEFSLTCIFLLFFWGTTWAGLSIAADQLGIISSDLISLDYIWKQLTKMKKGIILDFIAAAWFMILVFVVVGIFSVYVSRRYAYRWSIKIQKKLNDIKRDFHNEKQV